MATASWGCWTPQHKLMVQSTAQATVPGAPSLSSCPTPPREQSRAMLQAWACLPSGVLGSTPVSGGSALLSYPSHCGVSLSELVSHTSVGFPPSQHCPSPPLWGHSEGQQGSVRHRPSSRPRLPHHGFLKEEAKGGRDLRVRPSLPPLQVYGKCQDVTEARPNSYKGQYPTPCVWTQGHKTSTGAPLRVCVPQHTHEHLRPAHASF